MTLEIRQKKEQKMSSFKCHGFRHKLSYKSILKKYINETYIGKFTCGINKHPLKETYLKLLDEVCVYLGFSA